MALGLNNSKIRSDFEDAGGVGVGEGGGVYLIAVITKRSN